MKKNNQIAKAVALALTGTALSFGMATAANATVTTMYNMSSSGVQQGDGTKATDPVVNNGDGTYSWTFAGGTDGWANGAFPSNATGTVASQGWLGSAGAPFGYTGAHLNWGADFTGVKNTATISTYDAFNRYGVYADIDTARGAWAATNTGATQAGWRHDLDVGLFKTDHDVYVTLSATSVNTDPSYAYSNFGFTIFKGMDTVTKYNHHGNFNAGNNTAGATTASLIGGVLSGTGLGVSDIIAYTVGGVGGHPLENMNTISFWAQAGQIYTIALGGYMNGTWSSTNNGYSLTITTVPEPSSLLLIGAAAAGFRATRRKS